jgi:dipeptidyl aminopeptidase/acylaminoacyl peptidase
MPEATWRRRIRAARITLPMWARDRPERLLYASSSSGKWELYAWDREQGTHRQVTDRPEGTTHGRLDPTGEWIWWFDDAKGNEFGRWFIEPFGGDDPAQPAAPKLRLGYAGGLALARDFALIGLSDDDGSTVHLVREGDPDLLYEHREEATVAGLSRDETMFALSHSEHGDSRHPDVRVLDLSGKALAELSDGPGRGLWPSGWSRVPGDGRLIVTHERTDLPRPLVWLPSTNDSLEPEIDLPGEVGASWYPDGRALLLWHDHRGRTELYRLALDNGSRPVRLDVPAGTIEGAAVRPDGEVWFGRSSGSTPPEIRSGTSVLLRPPGEAAPAGVEYQDLDVEGIHIFLIEPPGERPHPAIFLVHGGPTHHDRDVFSPRFQAWVDHGFSVVLVNYRGSTGYGKAWRDALEHDPGFPEVADVTTVRDRLVADGRIDPGRTVLSGGSWGGYITLLGLGTRPEAWSLGIAAVPVADYVAAFEDEMEPLKAFDRALFGGSPEEIPQLYAERSPITYVERVRVPVMILAGQNDPRCPIRQIDNYIARLEELGAPHEVYRYDAGHGSLVTDETIRQTEAMLAFASKHLGTPAPAAS